MIQERLSKGISKGIYMKFFVLFFSVICSLSSYAFSFGDLTSHAEALGCKDYDKDNKICLDDKFAAGAPKEESSSDKGFGSFESFGSDLTNVFSTKTNKESTSKKINLDLSNKAFVSEELDKLCKKPVSEWDSVEGLVSLSAVGSMFVIDSWLSGESNTKDRQLAMKQKIIHTNWLPMPVEKGIGNYIHTQKYQNKVLTKENARGRDKKNIEKGNAIWGTVVETINKDYPEHPYEWKFHLVKGKSIGRKAFAISGGYIYLGTDLLKNEDEDVLKMILFHEAAHVLKRHYTKRYQALFADVATSIDMIKDLASAAGNQNTINRLMETIGIIKHVEQLIAGFDDQQEFEADACAVMAANKSDIPKGKINLDFVRYVNKVTDTHGDTHGNPQSRTSEIKNVVNYYY